MRYRILGRTGFDVSEIGVGGHEYRRSSLVKDGRFTELDPDRPAIIAKALEMGVNYFDTTFTEETQSLGAALTAVGAERDKVYINAMVIKTLAQVQNDVSQDKWGQLLEKKLTERLNLLNTEYVDIFTVCLLEEKYSDVALEHILRIYQSFKSRGLIRYIGASGHNPELMAKVIEKFDCFDMVMTPLNYAKGPCENLHKAITKHNVGFVAMKAFAWDYYGLSFVPARAIAAESYELNGVTPAQMALRWVLQFEEVATVVCGVNSMEELVENASAGELGSDNIDTKVLESCRNYPGQVEKMIDLIDHDYADFSHYALYAVKQITGEDFGTDKVKYLEKWKQIKQKH